MKCAVCDRETKGDNGQPARPTNSGRLNIGAGNARTFTAAFTNGGTVNVKDGSARFSNAQDLNSGELGGGT